MIGRFIKEHLSNNKALQFFHLLRQGSTILIAIILTKSALNADDIGVYELLLYLGYTFSFFWISGLIQGLLTTFPEKEEEEQRAIFLNAYLVFTGISALIFLILLGAEDAVLLFFTGKAELPYYHIFLFYFLFNLPTYLLENFYLLKNNPIGIVWFGIFSFGAHFVAVLLPVFLGLGLLWSFYALVALAVVKHIWLLFFLLKNARIEWKKTYVKEWLFVSAPLIVYAFIAGFNQSFGSWLVNFHYEGDQEVFAIFRYGARELPLAMAMATAFNAVMLPEVVKNIEQATIQIRQKSLKLLHLLFPISILLMLSSHWWFAIVFNADFQASALIFNVFLLILISRMMFPQTILIGLKANNAILVVSIVELTFNIVISFILVYYVGLIGVALGTVLAYSLEKLLLCIYLQYRFGIRLQDYVHLKWFSFYSLTLLACFLLSLPWHS